MRYDYNKMAAKLAKSNKTPINENDPYGFMQEFDLNKYDREYTDSERKAQEKNPFGKAKSVK